MHRAGRRLRGALVGALLVGAVATGGTGASGQELPEVDRPPLPTGCAAPFGASFSADVPYRTPVLDPSFGGDPLPWPSPGLDTDGDGTFDSYELAPTHMTIYRTTGDLTLEGASSFRGGDGVGDLDGDGRSELIVATGDVPAPAYLVSGATPDGSHPVADVGIALPVGYDTGRTMGDVDGDGLADVMIRDLATPAGRQLVFSGTDLLAPGPGGAFDADDLALASYDGIDAGTVAFDATRATAITSPDLFLGRDGDDVTLVVQGDPQVRLTTAGSGRGLPSGPVFTASNASAVVRGDRLWITLFVPGDTGDAVIWVWELTDLCGPGPVVPDTVPGTTAPTTPSSPAATPIASTARFTG